MDANKSLKISKYVFGTGFMVCFLRLFTSLAPELDLFVFYFAGCMVMAVGLYLNLEAKVQNPLKKKLFYATVLVLTVFPLIGPLAAIGIMFGTTDPSVPTHKWRTTFFSPSMIGLYFCVVGGLLAYPQIYSFRAHGGHVSFKAAQREFARAKESEELFAMAGESGRNEDFRKAIDEAASDIVSARRNALTDANTGWYVRYFLSHNIVKESELAGLEAAIGAAKASYTAR